MSDPHNSNPAPTTRTLFTVEIVHGSSEELNELVRTIVQLGVESAIACARVQMVNRKNAPEVKLTYAGTVTE